MKTVIVANPKAGAGRVGRSWEKLSRSIFAVFGVAEVRFTSGPGDATLAVRAAIREGAERVVAVGGDGSVNECVNGFFDEEARPIGRDVVLAVFPAGTGGDFSRSIGLSRGDVAEAYAQASTRRVDLGRAVLTGADDEEITRYFINISSFGASGLVVDRVNRTPKTLGGRASYLWGTVRGLTSYRNRRVRLRVDDAFEEEILINTVAVANGRYFGGAMMIAPEAKLDDGLFDVVIIGDVGLGHFLRNSPRLYRGKHLGLPGIRMLRGKKVSAVPLTNKPVLLETDGEQPGCLPVRYEILPRAIRLLAPWGRVETLSGAEAVTQPAVKK